jgi:signal transduction histidine kinase
LTLIDLRPVIAEIANEWCSLIEARNLKFSQQFADRELPVLADRSAVQRLLAILLDNAVKYTPPPGAIEMELDTQEDMAVITVRDSGIGIAESEQSKIFERFYRVDKARSRELGGAGIGLAIAEWIVQQHRGSITVQSRLGKGASFSVAFPLQSTSAALDQTSKSAISATG